jgi:gamma-glutamylputrescine oxidase
MTNTIFAPDFKSEPVWWEAARPFDHADALPEKVDLVVVGSGFCGLSAGIRSLELGRSTLVVDAGPIGGMASCRSGAMLSSGQKFLLNGSFRDLDSEHLGILSRIHSDAFELVKSFAEKEAMDMDFQQSGRLFLASSHEASLTFREHARILRERAGVTTSVLSRDELQTEIGTTHYHGGMLVKEFGGIHPSKFAMALAKKFQTLGGKLISRNRVLGVAKLADGTFRVRSEKGESQAKNVLFATNGYSDRALAPLRQRVAPVASYIVATERIPRSLMDEVMPRRRMYSDTKRNLWYFRPSPEGDRILFGARPRAWVRDTREAAVFLQRFLTQVFPQLASIRISHCWTGNVAMTNDHLQHIGSFGGVHYAVGCNGSGAAIMPYLGRLAVDRMLGIEKSPSLLEQLTFRKYPPYGKTPWFVPFGVLGLSMLDWIDEKSQTAWSRIPK